MVSTAGVTLANGIAWAGTANEDEEICLRKFQRSVDKGLERQPIGGVMVAIASSFLGTPYVANTLEVPGEEHLVINLRGLDCVSLVENTLSLSRCVKLGTTTFDNYRAQLRLIRYRNGVIDGYPSRLHYFSDWIENNAQKKIVINVTEEIGGVPYDKTIHFMTRHISSYRQLANPAFVEALRSTEETISQRKLFYIPKDSVAAIASRIHDGDIIAITTSIDGLDISHTAIAARDNGELKILHAPIVGKAVELSATPLAEHLAAHEKQTGIMVARPVDPVPPKTSQD
jgi:N-acetylmuramoyl-L-alanine amidase-like